MTLRGFYRSGVADHAVRGADDVTPRPDSGGPGGPGSPGTSVAVAANSASSQPSSQPSSSTLDHPDHPDQSNRDGGFSGPGDDQGPGPSRTVLRSGSSSPTPHRVFGRPWKPGQSGNPSGLPKDIAPAIMEARRLSLSHAPKAIARLAELLDDKDPRVRLAAAEGILDRAGVKPIALDEEQGKGGGSVTVVLALPPRESTPSFLVGPGAVTALPAAAAVLEASKETPR